MLSHFCVMFNHYTGFLSLRASNAKFSLASKAQQGLSSNYLTRCCPNRSPQCQKGWTAPSTDLLM